MKERLKQIFALLMIVLLLSSSAMAQAKDITDQCRFWLSEGKRYELTDDSIRTGWKPEKENGEIRVQLPDNAGYLLLDWLDDPKGYVFVQYDEDKNVISESGMEDYACISQLFVLDENARYAAVRQTSGKQQIQNISVYSEGDLPRSVRNFLPPHEQCDLLVFSAHQDDEWIFFGGVMPYYEYVMEKKVQLVYMADCGRFRKNEALNGLWAGGMKHAPVFVDLVDEKISSLSESLDHWGGKKGLTEVLVTCIRRFRPEVILTHDIDGEYGHNQHKLTARAMETAIKAAADPSQFPKSYEKYGAWQVKKLYHHLAKDNEINFDWNKIYDQLDGYTPLQVAKIAYSKHVSQQKAYQVVDGGQYDNSRFGLTYSTVGEDVRRDDLFENILPDPTATPVPTPEPTAEPTIESTSVPTPAPTAVPTPAPSAVPEQVQEKGNALPWIAAGIAFAGIIAACALVLRGKKTRRRRGKSVRRR